MKHHLTPHSSTPHHLLTWELKNNLPLKQWPKGQVFLSMEENIKEKVQNCLFLFQNLSKPLVWWFSNWFFRWTASPPLRTRGMHTRILGLKNGMCIIITVLPLAFRLFPVSFSIWEYYFKVIFSFRKNIWLPTQRFFLKQDFRKHVFGEMLVGVS